MSNPLHAVAVMLFAVLMSGCAAMPGRTTNHEEIEGFNRGVYNFNDKVDRATLKPLAKGYRKITPQFVRTGLGNFFNNLTYFNTIANQFLQGKGKLGFQDLGRFLLNSTFGLGGLFDVATKMGLEAHDEDFGQTLAVWGVGSGPFINLPLFGPSSVRDAPARVFDVLVDPFTFVDVPWEATWGQRGLNAVQRRSELLPLDATIQRAYDPYAFVRDAWVQRREYEIFDGNPPAEELLPEDTTGEEPPPEQPQPTPAPTTPPPR
jgi:phospholipid-binding lipoprotein MlaA